LAARRIADSGLEQAGRPRTGADITAWTRWSATGGGDLGRLDLEYEVSADEWVICAEQEKPSGFDRTTAKNRFSFGLSPPGDEGPQA